MSEPRTAADPLAVIMDPRKSFDERRAALLAFSRDLWSQGWDECDAAYREAIALSGLLFDLSTIKPRHPDGRA